MPSDPVPTPHTAVMGCGIVPAGIVRSQGLGGCMRRREFLKMIAGLAAAWPLAASAQQAGKIVTIGILAIEAWPPIDTFRQALNDLGYVKGKNVRFEHRYAQGRNDRFAE